MLTKEGTTGCTHFLRKWGRWEGGGGEITVTKPQGRGREGEGRKNLPGEGGGREREWMKGEGNTPQLQHLTMDVNLGEGGDRSVTRE